MMVQDEPGVQIWLEGVNPEGDWIFLKELTQRQVKAVSKRYRPDRYRIIKVTIEIPWGGKNA